MTAAYITTRFTYQAADAGGYVAALSAPQVSTPDFTARAVPTPDQVAQAETAHDASTVAVTSTTPSADGTLYAHWQDLGTAVAAALYQGTSGALTCTTPASDPGINGPLPPPNTAAAATAIAYARARLGFPYLWGGTGPTGYDCSGLVLMAYRSAGINLSRVSEQQISDGVAVPRDQIQPGDLVFFDPGPAGPGHVGIALGNGQMIDAPHTGAVVRIESIDTFGTYVGARRVTGA